MIRHMVRRVYKYSGAQELVTSPGRGRRLDKELAYEIGLEERKSFPRREILRNESRPGRGDIGNDAIGIKSPNQVKMGISSVF